MPLFSNIKEPTEVRLAAVAGMLSQFKDISMIQHLATTTWFEPSNQIKTYILSTFKSLANRECKDETCLIM